MTTRNKIIAGVAATVVILVSIWSAGVYKKKTTEDQELITPYNGYSINLVYNLLFCDDLNLYKENTRQPYPPAYDVLFSESSTVGDLQKLIDDPMSDPRIKLLAYNEQREKGHRPDKKELIAVIIELGLDNGLDVLASFNNGTARYINQSGKILVWETTKDDTANQLTQGLFANSQHVVNQIKPWDKPRKPQPSKGDMRITFLSSDGLYFTEAQISALFNDPLVSPALIYATQLMKYVTKKGLEGNK